MYAPASVISPPSGSPIPPPAATLAMPPTSIPPTATGPDVYRPPSSHPEEAFMPPPFANTFTHLPPPPAPKKSDVTLPPSFFTTGMTSRVPDTNLEYTPPEIHWFYKRHVDGHERWLPFSYTDSFALEQANAKCEFIHCKTCLKFV